MSDYGESIYISGRKTITSFTRDDVVYAKKVVMTNGCYVVEEWLSNITALTHLL
jgi:hypothetical protein